MKYSIDLVSDSSKEWIDAVLADFGSFLQDHANCERKASAMAMSFVAKYPDKHEIIPELIDTGIEELEHFQQVYNLMAKMGIPLSKEIPEDLYVKQLMALTHGGTPQTRFMDRLLIASVIECRGCERFKLVSENHPDEEMQRYYKFLWTSEAKHGNSFAKMALNYFDEDIVYQRLGGMMEKEAEILARLEIKAALH